MGTSQQRHILFVVGMHRSGTSAVCAALEACGAVFGDDLLAPMPQVNDRGFWEAGSVVALNEELLRLSGTRWYSLSAGDDFTGAKYDECRSRACELLATGFGDGRVEAIKDPRFCLTLPFWLQACDAVGLEYSACVVHRHPLAIARSLEARDGLPLGYGLRLAALYERSAIRAVPAGTPEVVFEALIEDPAEALAPLFATLPLRVDEATLRDAVDAGLRHHGGHDPAAVMDAGWGSTGREDFDAWAEEHFPWSETLAEFADRFVDRGQELTRIGGLHSTALATITERDAQLAQVQGEKERIGELHTEALATIAEKDRQLEAKNKRLAELATLYDEACDSAQRLEAQRAELGDMHSRALAVIDERDQQIREFDRRLAEMGRMHGDALSRLEELDEQLAYLRGLPLLGRTLEVLLRRARR